MGLRARTAAVGIFLLPLACGQTEPIVGTWETELHGGKIITTFAGDGSFTHRFRAMSISNGDLLGHWERRGGELEMTLDDFEGPFAHYFEPGVRTTWRVETLDDQDLIVEAVDGEWFGFRPGGTVTARFRRTQAPPPERGDSLH